MRVTTGTGAAAHGCAGFASFGGCPERHPRLDGGPGCALPLLPRSRHFTDLPLGYPQMHSDSVIAIVDHDRPSREDLARLVATFGHRAQAFASGAALLEGAHRQPPCCVVLDAHTSTLAGVDFPRRIGDRSPATAIVFVSSSNDVEAGVAAMKSGAIDYLLKPVRAGALHDAVARAIAVSRERRAQLATVEWAYQRYARLSPRERQIFGLVLKGKRNKQIALELSSCESTIKVHRARISQKLEARSLVEMLMLGTLVHQHRDPAAGDVARLAANE